MNASAVTPTIKKPRLRRIRISERQQVLLIIPMAILALAAIWFFVLYPQFERRSENESLRNQLAESPYANTSIKDLEKIAKHEQELGRKTEQEWNQTMDRLATFADLKNMRKSDFKRIDYKVELFQARLRLLRRSEELGVQLIPRDLGLKDALSGSEEVVRPRMFQLRTVERLVDLTLSQRAVRLRSIHPMEPIPHKGGKGKSSCLEVPVSIDFEVAFDDLYLFFQSVFVENQVFVLRNIRVSSGPEVGSPLRVQAIMSSLIFE